MNLTTREAATVDVGGKGLESILYLRMVEIFSYFVIVFVARDIASFTYKAHVLLSIFLGGIGLHIVGYWLSGYRSRLGLPLERATSSLLWYSSVLDFAVVLAIVYLTGTIESPFLILLVVPLFFVSHVFSRALTASGFLVAVLAAVAALGYLEIKGAIPHFNCYVFSNDIYLNAHYYVGSLLVLGGFLSLILFLATTFQDRFNESLKALRQKDLETKGKINELSRLYDISLGINAVMTVETLLKMVAKEASLLLDQPWASIVLFNQAQEITHSVFIGIPEHYHVNLGNRVRKGGITEWLRKNNKPIIVEDVLGDKRASDGEFLMATKIRSLIGLPITNGQYVMGAFYVGDFVKKKFDENHVRLLAIMSDQLGIAIAKSKLYETIQRKIQSHEKKIETLEKVNELKSEYVSHVSHELRTPLTSIKAYMETLERHIEDPTFKEKRSFLGIVSKETDRLIRIVNDILDVSSIEFGQRPIERESFNVEETIYEVVSMLQPKLDEKNIKVKVVIPESLPKVDADKDLVARVFINLITNAVKYSPENTMVTVRVKEEAVDLLVSIEDQGIGIPEEQVEKIFDKYFRVKSDSSRHYDGVGLGLAIVKNIIAQHGGTIRVTSQERMGSTFTFTLPKEHCTNDLLGYITDGVSAKSELQEMLALIVRMIAELLSAKIVSLMLLDQTRSELFIKVSYGLDEWIVDQARVKIGEGIAGKVAETGMPLLIDNIEKNEIYISPNNPQYETMSLLSVPIAVNNVIVGVINVNNKTSGQPFNQDDMNLLMSFSDRISKALERLRTTEDSHRYLEDTIEAFRKMIELQVKTRAIERIVELALKVSRKLGLSEKEVKVIQYVASVHDIGMTKISDDILNKTFELTPQELREIQQHPKKGTELMRPLEFVELVSNIILHHHERVDGLGYPMGLKGSEIPIGSRILSIIDAFQSMTSERPYRHQCADVEAVREIIECAGKQFDQRAVECFIEVLTDEGRLSAKETKELQAALHGMVQESRS